MKSKSTLSKLIGIAASLVVLLHSGCHWKQYYDPPSATPLGALSDPVWENQEANAEVSDFVVHQHEFEKNVEFLNTDGEDHVKQIAARLFDGQEANVIVERSRTTPREDTKFGYPVHVDPKLDMRRREIVVRSLLAMGIDDAQQRVVVAPAYVPGIPAHEAEGSYQQVMSSSASGSGFGGFFFGGGSRF